MFGRRIFLWAIAAALLCSSAACDGSSTELPMQPTEPPPTGPAELQITDLTVGTGTDVVNGSVVIMHYAVWRYDPAGPDSKGQLLEASRTVGTGQPFQFTVGATTGQTVIVGLSQGAVGMKVGGHRRLIIPPNLAYGSTGFNQIRPNEWIVFELEVLASTNPT